MNPRHVDTILVKNHYEFFSENLGIDSTRDRYRESFFSSFATIRKKRFLKKLMQVVRRNGEIWELRVWKLPILPTQTGKLETGSKERAKGSTRTDTSQEYLGESDSWLHRSSATDRAARTKIQSESPF